MQHIHGGDQQEHGKSNANYQHIWSSGAHYEACRGCGADTDNSQYDGEPPRGRGRSKLSPTLQIPKNRSTGNLAVVSESTTPEHSTSRIRFSFDAGSSVDYDSITRSSLITEHDHGLGLSGLRRIRQNHPIRAPTLPSSATSSRSPSTSLARSTSLVMMMSPVNVNQMPMSAGPSSPSFTEDLSRFPSESLHSFSFAHKSEDFIQNRQSVLKRSIEFMRDRMGWAVSHNAAIASAQARVNGDIETQTMLDLLARAQLVGAGNLPQLDTGSAFVPGPLTGPAEVSGLNIFDKDFVPRTSSPESFATPLVSPTDTRSPRMESLSAVTSAESQVSPKAKPAQIVREPSDSENSSRSPTDESGTTAQTSPPISRKPTLKRTYTDVAPMSMQQKLLDTLAQPFVAGQQGTYPDVLVSPTLPANRGRASFNVPGTLGSTVHGHATRWVPAAQAIFTTESKPPWTILAANDLACLVFGVTKAEVRKMGILEVVQEERRAWLENKLQGIDVDEIGQSPAKKEVVKPPPSSSGSALLGGRGGITAQLLSKPNSRAQPPKASVLRAQTVHSGDTTPSKPRALANHSSTKSRGVLLCGDVVPIQKRNGATGAASLWVKEKRVGLIWVLEEIHEDVAYISLDEDGIVTKISGETATIWGENAIKTGVDIGNFITRIPRQGIDPREGAIDYAQIARRKYFTCRNTNKANIPATITQTRGQTELRVSSFPHIAGIVVVESHSLHIKSSNSVFCGALFGYEKPDGVHINTLIPDFDKIIDTLTEQEGVDIHDGIVIPEHNFRKAAAFFAVRAGRPDATTNFLNPEGLPARHRDGTELKIDVQMRVVNSEKRPKHDSDGSDDELSPTDEAIASNEPELVYALWITYSRQIHAPRAASLVPGDIAMPGIETPLHQPSPGQTPAHTPRDIGSDNDEPKKPSTASSLTKQLKNMAISATAKITGAAKPDEKDKPAQVVPRVVEPATEKKSIDDFTILEDMGQGAYGQVKLARYKHNGGRKVVLKYVTKRRILVDTWTRDRKLGTIPLEIHVLNFLRKEEYKHPNIVEMEDFFEDETNYYIEMAPHGLPGMDLFDYIELRANMEEAECQSIFVQVAKAVHHLHTKAKVVHRDIKDENVILDGEGHIKLIDFGSAAYIKSGPFDVFVGTIDYAAPEVLAGRPYGGKEQDIWALGILLYTIIYKENPFYSIDEIMDRDLRVPYTISDESIDLIRCMLDRDVTQRYDIDQLIIFSTEVFHRKDLGLYSFTTTIMAPTNNLVHIVTKREEEAARTNVIVGLTLLSGFILIIAATVWVRSIMRKREEKKHKELLRSQGHHSHHHSHNTGQRHSHSRSHGASRSGHTRPRSNDTVRGPRLERPLPVIPAGTGHIMRATTQRGKSSPPSSSRSKPRSKPTHKVSRCASITTTKPPGLERAASNKARNRRSSAPERFDPLDWPLPRTPVVPMPTVRAEIKPAPGHVRQPSAFERELRRTENFHLTQSERGDRIRDDEEEDGSMVRTEVSESNSSGICDYLKLLNSDDTPALEDRRDAAKQAELARSRSGNGGSRPSLPAIDIKGGLKIELEGKKHRV
ncbi:putative Protein kinase domain-containing protein [Seiridium unicorne]|uniref:Protein kinase domain-containing protein n=1 Tax=Seiridium unicorne TaxID=138068 RepID=A0ABR2UTQ0_9PEZI